MSEADKMFEELGYYKTSEKEFIIYTTELNTIEFDTENQMIYFGESWIDMDDLKAINKKVKELGWM